MVPHTGLWLCGPYLLTPALGQEKRDARCNRHTRPHYIPTSSNLRFPVSPRAGTQAQTLALGQGRAPGSTETHRARKLVCNTAELSDRIHHHESTTTHVLFFLHVSRARGLGGATWEGEGGPRMVPTPSAKTFYPRPPRLAAPRPPLPPPNPAPRASLKLPARTVAYCRFLPLPPSSFSLGEGHARGRGPRAARLGRVVFVYFPRHAPRTSPLRILRARTPPRHASRKEGSQLLAFASSCPLLCIPSWSTPLEGVPIDVGRDGGARGGSH